MHVEALAGAHVGKARVRVLNHGQVLCRRELAVGFAAVDQRHRQSGPFGDGRVVGQIVAAGRGRGFVGGQNVREAKALRGLRPPKTGTPNGLRDAAPGIRPLQGVGKRDRRNGARRVVQSSQHALDNIRRDERPDAVMDQDAVRGLRRQARRPLSTERCRVSPPVAGGISLGWPEATAAIVQRAVVRPDHDRHQIDVRRSDKNAHGPRQEGTPPTSAYCLGVAAPARVPRPAATIRAAVFKGLLAGKDCKTHSPCAALATTGDGDCRAIRACERHGCRLVCTIDVQLEKMPNIWAIAQMLG